MFILDSIPPPVNSDGVQKTHPPVGSSKFKEVDSESLAAFLVPLSTALKDAYTTRPEMMTNFDMEKALAEGYSYQKDAQLRELPANYRAFELDGEILIFGHPSALSFSSALDFLPHLLWLIKDCNLQHSRCVCKLCPVYVSRFRPPQPYPYNQQTAQHPSLPHPVYTNDHLLPPNNYPPDYDQRPSKRVKIAAKSGANNEEVANGAEDLKYKEKYKTLKKKVQEIMTEVDSITGLLSKSKSRIEKLKFERKFLYRKLEEIQQDVSKKNPKHSDDMSDGGAGGGSSSDLSLTSDDAAGSDDETGTTKPAATGVGNTESPATSTPNTPKPKKKKAPVDPNAPKRPANAFMLFCDMERNKIKQERDAMKEQMPGSEEDAGLGNITKALGNRWKSLPEEERNKYQQLFREEVKRYNAEMVTYKEGLDNSTNSTTTATLTATTAATKNEDLPKMSPNRNGDDKTPTSTAAATSTVTATAGNTGQEGDKSGAQIKTNPDPVPMEGIETGTTNKAVDDKGETPQTTTTEEKKVEVV